MRVLWLCNVIVPQIQEVLNLPVSCGGGWLEQTLDKLIDENIGEIAYCAPIKSSAEIVHAEYRGVRFYGFSKKNWKPNKYDMSVEKTFEIILNEFKPDIVHIFGTEFAHSFAMVKVFGKPDKTVIHLQGIMSFIAQCYDEGIPEKVLHGYTFRDFIMQDNIYKQKIKFEKRAEFERKALKNVQHVMGRTEWDQTCVKLINSDVTYHYCRENLRSVFYNNDDWNISKCKRHMIFMSQGDYPIKGLHMALKALAILKKKYPDIQLHIAGEDILVNNSLKHRIRQNSYMRYLNSLIDKFNLQENVKFLGWLNAEKMYEMYMRCNVFILPSAIENSPNSLCEALQLGVPSVASFVGGIPEFIVHGKNGYLYQYNAPYMLAHYIDNILADDKIAKTISSNAKIMAKGNIDDNIDDLIKIYKSMIQI